MLKEIKAKLEISAGNCKQLVQKATSRNFTPSIARPLFCL